jgi:hypothetical protein
MRLHISFSFPIIGPLYIYVIIITLSLSPGRRKERDACRRRRPLDIFSSATLYRPAIGQATALYTYYTHRGGESLVIIITL